LCQYFYISLKIKALTRQYLCNKYQYLWKVKYLSIYKYTYKFLFLIVLFNQYSFGSFFLSVFELTDLFANKTYKKQKKWMIALFRNEIFL